MVLKEIVLTDNLNREDASSMYRLDEVDLVNRAKVDPEAFGKLYDLTYDRILNYIYRRIMNITIAEELTSRTYFKALKAFPKYRYRAPFIAWLYRIATNEIRMYFRAEKTNQQITSDPRWKDESDRISFSSPETRILAEDEIEERMHQYSKLHHTVQMLPEKYQTVIALRYFENMSYDEISQVLGKKSGTVKSLLHRGLKLMKGLMEDHNRSSQIAEINPSTH